MSAIVSALLAELSDADLDSLAERLAPRLATRLLSPARDLGWLRGADEIAAYIGAPKSRVYALASAGRIPIVRDGSALLSQRHELDAWVRAGGGKRP